MKTPRRPVGPLRQRLATLTARLSVRLDPFRPVVHLDRHGYVVQVAGIKLATISSGQVQDSRPVGQWAPGHDSSTSRTIPMSWPPPEELHHDY